MADLARRAHMSPRTFARRFRAETGTTPHHWLTGQRVCSPGGCSRRPSAGRAIAPVRLRQGRGAAAPLHPRLGTTPKDYRRTFCTIPA